MAPLAARAQGAQAPLLDRELFFGDPEISGAQLSPERAVPLVHQALQGHAQRLGEEGRRALHGGASVLTADTKRAGRRSTSGRATASYVLYVQDQGGDENYNVYAVNPADDAGRRPGRRRPRATSPTPRARGR